jgi:CheY-like chemotaxis protein
MSDIKRILLAEDSLNDIELISETLAEINLANEVIVVRDGAEALDYLFRRGAYTSRAPGHPTVVLLDLMLPKIDGIEVLKQIKSDPQLKIIPVVMLTSSDLEQDSIRSYDLGANAYVVKPANFADFSAALREMGLFWVVLNEAPRGNLPTPNQ